ncbi:MAG: PHP domain-containing protein, partial [Candidatus Eiseniibacteriota bacterium]
MSETGLTWVAHAHTRHSYDCLSDPFALVAEAVRLGIDVLAITDHDTWEGSVEAERRARAAALPVRIVRGNERATDQGDVIGLFLEEDVREKNALAFCDAVHAQGGLVLLPHPFKWRAPSEELLARVDLIEA